MFLIPKTDHEFSLNVCIEFNEFSDESFMKNIIQNSNYLCRRPICYNKTSKTQKNKHDPQSDLNLCFTEFPEFPL